MDKKEQNMPEWFWAELTSLQNTKLFSDPQAISKQLSDTRKEMYDALEGYHAQVRGIQYFITAPLSIVIALLGFAFNDSVKNSIPLIRLAAVTLFVIMLLGLFVIVTIRERYRAYVSSVVYATKLHVAAGDQSHPWLEWVIKYLIEAKPKNTQELINYWMQTPPNSYLYYSRMIQIFSLLAFAASLFLFWITL